MDFCSFFRGGVVACVPVGAELVLLLLLVVLLLLLLVVVPAPPELVLPVLPVEGVFFWSAALACWRHLARRFLNQTWRNGIKT